MINDEEWAKLNSNQISQILQKKKPVKLLLNESPNKSHESDATSIQKKMDPINISFREVTKIGVDSKRGTMQGWNPASPNTNNKGMTPMGPDLNENK